MEKQGLLQAVTQLVQQGSLSKDELLQAYAAGKGEKRGIFHQHIGITQILYVIGAAIVVLGIIILIAQNWDDLNTFTHILVTFGSSVAAYIVAVLLRKYNNLKGVSEAFFLISNLILPLGLGVIYDAVGYDVGTASVQTLISCIALGVYLVSYLQFKSIQFLIVSIITGTWLFFALTSLLVSGRPEVEDWHFTEYRILLTGLTYLLLGYYFVRGKEKELTGPLYSFGLLAFLGAAMSLGGWEPNQNMFWEVIYPGLVFGVIFLSIYLKSRAFLVFGTLFLMGYIIKITAEYFSDTLGWPLALVLAGFALIGVGYGTYHLNRKYLKQNSTV